MSDNLFDAIGLDYAVARQRLDGVPHISSEPARKAELALISAAALVDIAQSLAVVSLEARLSLPELDDEIVEDPASEGEDFFVAGDLVAVNGYDEPAEIRGFGVDQGERYANVLFASGAEWKAWVSTLTRIVGDERDDDAMQEAAEASVEAVHVETLAEVREVAATGAPLVGIATPEETSDALSIDDGDGEPAVGGYELDGPEAPAEEAIDADFGEAPDDALAALEAAEKKSKTTKSKKGGKR